MNDRFDYILRDGTVFDGSGVESTTADVAIRVGRVAAIAPHITQDAERVLNCRGYIVCPGLIDLHVHVFDGVSVWAVPPESAGLSTGVTTMVDAGTSGSTTFPGFRRYFIEPARSQVLAFLHIVTIGILTSDRSGVRISELSDPHYINVASAAETIAANRDLLVGVKLRLTASYTADDQAEARALDAALDAAQLAGVPLMLHHSASRLSTEQVMGKLQPGDIYTHCFHPHATGIVDQDLRVLPCVHEARERGVLFDVGHGAGSFGWNVAHACVEQGFWPDTISTDLHRYSIDGPVFDLPTTLSKFLHLGMPLAETIAAATTRAAAAINRVDDLGLLAPERRADITIMQAVEGQHRLTDAKGTDEVGSIRLIPHWTVCDGLLCAAGPRMSNSTGSANRESSRIQTRA